MTKFSTKLARFYKNTFFFLINLIRFAILFGSVVSYTLINMKRFVDIRGECESRGTGVIEKFCYWWI